MIAQSTSTKQQLCAKCQSYRDLSCFPISRSLFAANGYSPVCARCIDTMIADSGGDWAIIDKICQLLNVPFVPAKWAELSAANPVGAFSRYALLFRDQEYDNIGWSDYYKAFKELEAEGNIESELPLLSAARERQLREKWGGNYDNEALNYLEGLYEGLMATQNVNGSLQLDQAKKICKMSYEIDKRIEEGSDFDKLLGSYDKLVKAADFTPKNVKNPNDFDSFGEAIKFLEKRGWRNPYYDDVPRDVVDETIKNMQSFNQSLYINESGIGEEITQRLQALQNATMLEQETYYGTNAAHDLDKFEQEGLDFIFGEENDEFDPNAGGERV